MFCADYLSAFVFHGLLSLGLAEALLGPRNQQPKELQHKNPDKESAEHSSDKQRHDGIGFPQQALFHFILGSLAGLCGAVAVFPFDFVRRGVIQGPVKLTHSLSTVPYAGTFFGLYFSCRKEQNTSSQVRWAFLSSLLACCAEIPFDKAKLAMMGSRRTMLAANGLYVPFGALMLVMYDKALLNKMEQNKKQFSRQE